ncbi:Ribonuclease P protein subunit p29 [Cladophialophora carrionii]|uniref:Ribonuclease P protein subunit n=1 Tax=Cladophialophora carrionii TaxID=86049 RepID=A0A1C1C963_9EURO|nr:Ribonuclease P protein subunit p29 [Cladophialophora carrionii]
MTSSPRAANSPTTPSHPAHTLVARAHSPDAASRIFGDKIKNKPLLLNPTASADRDKRALRRHVRLRKREYYLRKRKPRPLSAKEKRELGVFELKKEEVRYEIYKGLHRMWVDYMLEVLGYVKDGQVVQGFAKTVTSQGHGPLLASADFHGAELEVVKCADTGRVGTKGIVVRDTKFTFVLVTPKDEVRVVPKKNTVFRYEIPLPESGGEGGQQGEEGEGRGRSLVFELHGNQFEFRPADRANRKFKWKVTDHL